ncbi:MAG: ATP-binding protein [Ignavibacteriales bacterium]|nr:ATP-binding protein [Ignavibacteriales bacterium]
MAGRAQKLTKTIESRTDNLLEVREFVLNAARHFGFGEEEASKIVLAVDEACTNVIKHAYQYAPDRSIEIVIRHEKDRLQITVIDDGKAFNPSAATLPDLKQHLSHYRRGGLGIYLMRTLMDKVEYKYAPGKRNEVRLTKYLSNSESRAHS